MRILISDLLKLSEEYLSYIRYQQKPLEPIKSLMEEFKERKLDSLHKSNLNIAEKYLNKPERINYLYYFDLFHIETSKIDFLIDRDKQSMSGINVLAQGEYLINFFLFGIFNIAHELYTHKSTLNVTFDFNLVDEILNNIDFEKLFSVMKKNHYKHFHILSIYYTMYLSTLYPEKTNYYF